MLKQNELKILHYSWGDKEPMISYSKEGFRVTATDKEKNLYFIDYLKSNNYKPLYSTVSSKIWQNKDSCFEIIKPYIPLPENTKFKDKKNTLKGGKKIFQDLNTNHLNLLDKIKEYKYYLEWLPNYSGFSIYETATNTILGAIPSGYKQLPKDQFYTPKSLEEETNFLKLILPLK